jgi:hypothetical protein
VADGLAQQAILLWQKAYVPQKASKVKSKVFFMVYLYFEFNFQLQSIRV